MTLIKRNQQSQLPRFFDSYLLKDLVEWPEVNHYRSNGSSLPAVNIIETNSKFELQFAAPGLQKESFSIQLDKSTLTVSSKKEEEKEETKKEGKYTLKEFSFQSFSRSFTLPENKIDVEKIEASYENGVLYLQLPKKEEKQPKVKKIEVK